MPQRRPAQYPATDGLLFSATFAHGQATDYLFDALRLHFKRRPDVFVGMEMFLYYTEGRPKDTLSPDVFVARGVPVHPRDSYRIWEVGKPPDFVMEVSSSATFWRDRREKKRAYAAIGVPEYWLFAPEPRRDVPQLVGYSLRHGRYEEVPPLRLAAGAVEFPSAVLGLGLRVEGDLPRLRDPETDSDLRSVLEVDRRREIAEFRRDSAMAERDAEAKARRVAEVERDTAVAERDTAVAERNAAVAERDAEARARRRLEAELASLRSARQ